jgi:hypothetical protein
MNSKTRLLWALPFLVLPVLLVVMLSSCQGGGPPPLLGIAQQALDGGYTRLSCNETCEGGATAQPLDEYNPLADAGYWQTLTCDGGPCCSTCDITSALTAAVSTVSNNTLPTSKNTPPTVLYIPPGNYTINATIQVPGSAGMTIIGDSPDTTSITWTGGTPGIGDAGGTEPMFLVLNSNNFKLARLTLNGGQGNVPALDAGCLGTPAGESPSADPCYAPGCPGGQPWLGGVFVAQTAVDGGVSTDFLDFDDDVFTNLTFGILTYPGTSPLDLSSPSGFGNVTSSSACYELYLPNGITTNVGNSDVRRCSFEKMAQAGITLSGANTIGWIIEDSAFIDCHQGIVLNQSTSNMNVVNNLFYNDDYGDAGTGDDSVNIVAYNSGEPDVYRGNVSIGANMFYWSNGDEADVSGNYVVLNPSTPHCFAFTNYSGQMLFLDNYFNGPTGPCSLNTETGPDGGPSEYGFAWLTNSSVVHGHNSYTGAPVDFLRYVASSDTFPLQERCVGGDAGCPDAGDSADQFMMSAPVPAAAHSAWVGWGSPSATNPPQRPTIAPTVSRPNIVVVNSTTTPSCTTSPGSGCAAALTSHLSSACASGPCLLYFPTGSYYIDGQIELPSSDAGDVDVAVVGDGAHSFLLWTGAPGPGASILDASFFHVPALTKATFRDLDLQALGYESSRPSGILIDSRDDPGGLVYVDKAQGTNVRSGLTMAGLDNVLVRAEQTGASGERGFDVIGGGAAGPASAGSGQTRGLYLLAPNFETSSDFVTLRNWGKAVIIGIDTEEGGQGILLTQSGYLTIDAGRLFTYVLSPYQRGLAPFQPNLVVGGTFRGNVTLANTATLPGLYAAGAPEAQVLAVSNWAVGGGAAFPTVINAGFVPPDAGTCNQVSPATVMPTPCPYLMTEADGGAPQMGILNTMADCGGTDHASALYYCTDSSNSTVAQNTFFDTMFADLRSSQSAAPICGTACGQTAVRIHNVTFTGGNPIGVEQVFTASFMRDGIRVQRSN